MTTLFQFQARKIERMAASLAHFVATTAPARLNWSPATDEHSSTRSVLSQVAECVGVNEYSAALLRGETPAPFPPQNGAAMPVLSGSDDAQKRLLDSGQTLAAAVRALDEDALTRIYHHWRGPLPGEIIIEMGYRNMAYHAGQINLIQLLNGDAEFHVPPSWL